MITGMSVATPTLVYAWPETKEEFDKINLPEVVHDWKEDTIAHLEKQDGQKWERRCHSKSTYKDSGVDVMVVFQWFEERPMIEGAGA